MGLLVLLIFIVTLVFIVKNKNKLNFMSFYKDIDESVSSVMTIDDKYNSDKVKKQKEIDRILDKINRRGYHTITKSEKNFLDNNI